MTPIRGIHHITAVAGDAVRNWRFYTGTLGERLVKKTVNFDDPGTYHLYYGDAKGSPGTILTFFPWAGMRRSPTGNNQVTATAYAVAVESLDWWRTRLRDQGIALRDFTRFGEPGLAFADPDGMPLELIGMEAPPGTAAREDGPVPAEHRLRGFHSATLTVATSGRTRQVLTDVLGLEPGDEEGTRLRFGFPDAAAIGGRLDLVADPSLDESGIGAGIVHHIAFRAEDQDHEAEIRERVMSAGLHPTGHVDRDYFMSVYFREPSGILFEIATDPPGFTRDEALDSLGAGLKLPAQHEHMRERLENSLPPIPPLDSSS